MERRTYRMPMGRPPLRALVPTASVGLTRTAGAEATRGTDAGGSGTHGAGKAGGLAGLVLVVGVLGGCDSEATPSATTRSSPSVTNASASPSVTPTPSPSASASVEIPAAARKKTEKGAEAFVRYFFDQVNAAWMTADPRPIASNSEADCKSCASLRRTAEDLKRKNRHYAATPVTVRETKAVAGAPAGQQFVEARLQQNRVDIIDASGRVVSTDKRDTFLRTVALVWGGERWLIYDVA
jgi:hypothetical protein